MQIFLVHSHRHPNNFHGQLDKYGRKHGERKDRFAVDILNLGMKAITGKDMMGISA